MVGRDPAWGGGDGVDVHAHGAVECQLLPSKQALVLRAMLSSAAALLTSSAMPLSILRVYNQAEGWPRRRIDTLKSRQGVEYPLTESALSLFQAESHQKYSIDPWNAGSGCRS